MLRRIIAAGVAVFGFAGASLAAPIAAPQCFAVPGISNCLDGRFQSFWNGNGGLPVFGYPVTAQRAERNADTGQTFDTQWFERNRFELHPENTAPYDVLLGRLGAELLARQGRGFEGVPAGAQPTGRCKDFDVGGKRAVVCDPFLNYWEMHGLEFDGQRGTSYGESLALFGLPLTYPKMETNPNGDTVMTQWFERGRFEDHGAQGVLLGLLGREVLGDAPAPPPPPPPTGPTPPPPSYNACRADPNADRAPNTPVQIVGIDKSAETVTLKNVSASAVDLTGWHMCSINGNQEQQGIGGALAAGEIKTFAQQGGNIWNNSEPDDGALYNPQGQLISYRYDRQR